MLYNSETSGIPLHMQVLKKREIKGKRQTKQKQISSAISLFLGDYTPFMFEHCLDECICAKKITIGQFCSATTPAPLFNFFFFFFILIMVQVDSIYTSLVKMLMTNLCMLMLYVFMLVA